MVITMKYKIMIIEDDPAIQTELMTLLVGNGYEASAVTDFSAAVQTVKFVQRDNQFYVDDNALSVNINRIREKLSNFDWMSAEAGRGNKR